MRFIYLLLFFISPFQCDISRADEGKLSEFDLLQENNPIESDVHFICSESQNESVWVAKYLTWIDSEYPDSLIPSFSFEGSKLLLDGQEVVSGKTKVSFANDLICDILDENDDIIKRYQISFNCPQINTELPVLRINIDPTEIKDKVEWKTARALFYNQTDTTWTYYNEEIKIRGRGNSSWSLPKKPYRIKFPKKISPIGLTHTKAKDWVLLAHDMDKSLIRNHLGFMLSRVLFNKDDGFHNEQDVCFTPCSQFVNVYFGNSYHGLYQFSDHKDCRKGRIDIEELTATQAGDENAIRGGYLLESPTNQNEPDKQFRSDKGICFEHLYPKQDDHADEQWQYIENYINNAEDVLYGENSTDLNIGWRSFFDEKSLVDYILVREFAQDMDGYCGTYLYKRRNCNQLFFGPIWDLDKAWGNDIRQPYDEYPPMYSLMIFAGFRMHHNPDDWFVRFWSDKNLRNLVCERWHEKKMFY